MSASITGTVNGNPGAEQVYLDLQGIGTYVAGDPIVTTDTQGKYSFTGLNAGNYLVRIKPQSGIFTTVPVWGGKYFVPLAANQSVVGDDFTVQNLPSLPLGNQSLVYGTGSNGRNFLERFNADGTADSTFGQNLVVGQPSTDVFHAILPASVTGNPSAATVQANGNIVVNYPGNIVTLNGSGVIISVTGTVTAINAPTGLTATATSPTSVRIDFTDNSTNEDTFILERSNSATGPFSLVSSIGGFGGGGGVPLTGPVSYIDTTAQPNTTYYYRVYGFNVAAAIQSAIAGPVSVTTPVVGMGGATISGTVFGDVNGDGTQNPHSEISGVQVYLDLPGIGQFVQGDPLTTTSINGKYVFTGVKPGNYLVRPIVPSNEVINTPLFGGKYFVQLAANQNVTGDDFGLYFINSAPHFTVNGQLIVAHPGVSSPTLRRFNTDSSVDVAFGTYGTVILPPTVTGAPSSIVPGTGGNLVATYPTAIVTLSSTGAILSVVPSSNTINAPTALTVQLLTINSVVQNAVTLSFIDNATNETGFAIERATLPGGAYSVQTVLPASNGSGLAVSYVDTTTTAGLVYGYRVRAINATTSSSTAGPVYVAMVDDQQGGTRFTQSDGKTIRAGWLAGIRISVPATITRYNTDGSVDPTFGTVLIPPTAFDSVISVSSIQLLPSGSFLAEITGGSSSNNPGTDVRLALINSTGQLGTIVTTASYRANDPSYDNPSILGVGSNGKIYVAGQHLLFHSLPPDPLVILAFNSDLTPDTTFGVGGRLQLNLPLANGANFAIPTGVSVEANGNIDVAYQDAPTNATHTLVLNSTGTVVGAAGGSISGKVFNDINFNGVQEFGENGVSGRQVYLDIPGIGVLSAGDPVTTTDASGNYSFTGLAAKNYLVRLVPLAGSGITSPIYGGKYFVQLSQNQNVTDDNFGTEIVNSFSSSYQGDGKLLAGDFIALSATDPVNRNAEVVRRFNTDGSLDLPFGSFGTSPAVEVTGLDSAAIFEKIRPLPNGNIVTWTNRYTVSTISYLDHLTLLSPMGQIISQRTVALSSENEAIHALGIQPDGKILVAGDRYQPSNLDASYIAVVKRFNSDLTPDTSFGVNGVSVLSNLRTHDPGSPNEVTALVDGRIQLGYGSGTTPVILTSSGALDPSLILPAATNVVATPVSPHDVVVQFTDNATTEQNYLIQYSSTATNGFWLTAGTVQGSPATGPRLFNVSNYPQPGLATFYRVIATNGVIRSDSSVLVTATTPSVTPGSIVLSNGKIVTSSDVLISRNRLVTYLTRSNPDGTPDTTFGTGGRVEVGEVVPPSSNNYSVPQIWVKPDGTLVVLSLNTAYASNTKGVIATLTSYDTNGNVINSADVTSSIGTGQPSGPDIEQIALTNDGKVLIAGSNLVFFRTTYSFVARFNADFTPDSTFGTFTPDPHIGTGTKGLNLTNIGVMNPADGIAQLPDGNIITVFGPYAVLLNSSGVVQPPGFNAPTNLSGSAVANNKVHLQFTDNAVNETGFVVERSSDGGATWSADIRPALSGTGIVQYDDFTALPSTTYQYRVFAVNGSLRTGYTGAVTITTPA